MTWRLAFAGVCVALPAHADKPLARPTAIEVDRDDTPVGRTELGFDGGAPVDGWGATLSLGVLESPVILTRSDGVTEPVRRRETLRLGGALALDPRVVVEARWGIARQAGDRLRGLGDPRPLDRYVPGDLHLGGRIRVTGDAARAVFVRGDLSLPTGDDRDFSGDASWSLSWRLIGRATLPADVVVAGTIGIRLRGAEVIVADQLVGDELVAAAGLAVPIPPVRPLWCVADQVRLTAELVAVAGNDVGGGSGPSPIEVRAGIVTRPLPSLTIGVRAGVGLNDAVGSPRLRALVELTYQGTGRLLGAPPAPASVDEPVE